MPGKHIVSSGRCVLFFCSPQSQVILSPPVCLQLDAITLPNNTLVAAYDDSQLKRSPLRLATSTDGGLTWKRAALIEDDPEGSFHYPALLYDAKQVGALARRCYTGSGKFQRFALPQYSLH